MQTNGKAVMAPCAAPGLPALRIDGAQHTFGNAAIALQWTIGDGRFHGFELADRVWGPPYALPRCRHWPWTRCP